MRLLGCLLLLHLTLGQQELFLNPNFEENFDGQTNWWCNNCQLQKSSDAHQGTQSGMVSQRNYNWAGISQYVPVEPLRTYQFYAHVKVLNQQPGFLGHRVTVLLDIGYVDGSPKHYQWISVNPYARQDKGWIRIGGDFTLGEKEIDSARFYVQFEELEVDYLIDTASLTELFYNPQWQEEADARIENIRKRDVEIRLNADFLLDPLDITIQVEQTKHEFPFGSAVQATLIAGTDATSQAYQNTFYQMFDWAVLENALKWKQMEWNRGQINYERPESALDALEQNGIPVRGHCVAWGMDNRVPDWLKPLDGTEVREAVATRIQGVVPRMRGRLVHWDVNNEQLHGPFFENKSGDHLFTESMFTDIRAQDADVKLFFNEFDIVNVGSYVYAYVEQVQNAVSNGIPVYGMGIQSQMQVDWKIEDIEKRLNVATEAGIPIWITELTVQNEDRDVRADGYEDLLRLYFSHPSVEGILVWGFWDQAHWRPTAALVEGPDFQLNAAGNRYMDLVHNEWMTDEMFFPLFNQETFDMRGFHGNYTLRVDYLSTEIHQQQFTVPKGEGPVVVNVVI